jgi:hypothetical protein
LAICYSSPTYDDEGEMETERDTTEQEETLLDNDKQPWLSVIVLRVSSCSVVSLSVSISPS